MAFECAGGAGVFDGPLGPRTRSRCFAAAFFYLARKFFYLARKIEQNRIQKTFWVIGSAVQGLAAGAIALSAWSLEGPTAGLAIVGALAVLAIARSACSASYKDVLSRTVEKGTRGRVSGTAGTVSAVLVFAFALLLATGVLPREPFYIACAIAIAGGLWLLAAAVFATLDEPEAEVDTSDMRGVSDLVEPLRQDSEFQSYVATRALLISTALSPPFLVMLGNTDGIGVGNLGLLILASSIAAIVSSYLWGALSDRSSRKVLMLAGAISALTLGAAAAFGFLAESVSSAYVVAAFVFTAQIAYQGARLGRKTHLTDMDTHGRKPVYTALSNSLIGMLLLAGGALGLLADVAGVPVHWRCLRHSAPCRSSRAAPYPRCNKTRIRRFSHRFFNDARITICTSS